MPSSASGPRQAKYSEAAEVGVALCANADKPIRMAPRRRILLVIDCPSPNDIHPNRLGARRLVCPSINTKTLKLFKELLFSQVQGPAVSGKLWDQATDSKSETVTAGADNASRTT